MSTQPEKQQWVCIKGDGLIYTGPCLVTDIIMTPDANQDYTDVYDGRDTTSGKKFARITCATTTTTHICLVAGVRFFNGIYLDAYDSAVETTVAFIPLISPLQ